MIGALITLQENILFAMSITQTFLRELESPSRIFHRKRRETDIASLDNHFPENTWLTCLSAAAPLNIKAFKIVIKDKDGKKWSSIMHITKPSQNFL